MLADAKNQVHTGNSTAPDYTYDAAGNMTSNVTDGVTASYDAENRISTATRNGVTTTYVSGAAPYSINNGNTCVTQVENPLVQTGILNPITQYGNNNLTESLPSNALTPGDLQQRLESQPGLVQSTQTVGQPDTGFWRSLWGTIKHSVGVGQ